MAEQRTTEAFVERVFGDMLGMASICAVYLGDRLGLYRALADGGPATAPELATRAGIAERYAREWLEQQAVSDVLDVVEEHSDHAQRRYGLPAAHAEVLANADSMAYLTPIARLLGAAAVQLPAIVDAYRSGGGVSWSQYGADMREGQGDQNRPLFLHQLGPELLPQVPGLHARLSGPARVADIGCGLGWSSIGIAQAYPQVTVDGYDLDAASIASARRHAEAAGVADRVRFHEQDAAHASGTYDLVAAFECLHDMPYPVDVLRAMRSLAGADGTVLIMDERVGEHFAAPGDPVERFMYAASLMVCLPDSMSHAGSAATGTVMRPGTLRSYAQEAGFGDIDVLPIEHDFFRFYRLTP